MNLTERINRVASRFDSGDFPIEELANHLEPLLEQASKTSDDEKIIKKIINDLEIIIFTLPSEAQKVAVRELLARAIVFVETR